MTGKQKNRKDAEALYNLSGRSSFQNTVFANLSGHYAYRVLRKARRQRSLSFRGQEFLLIGNAAAVSEKAILRPKVEEIHEIPADTARGNYDRFPRI